MRSEIERDREVFRIEDSVTTRIDARAVLERIRDPATWPSWQAEILSAAGPSPIGEGDVVRGRAQMLGFAVDGHSTVVGADGSSFEQDVIVGVRMRVQITVEQTEDGSVIRHSLTSRLPGGVWGRVLAFFLKRRFRVMQRLLLERLATPG